MEQKVSRREKRRQFRLRRNRILLLFLAVVSVAMIGYSSYCLWGYYADHQEEEKLREELVAVRESIKKQETDNGGNKTEEVVSLYEYMKEKNSDYVCWLTVSGTSIDYPVVQRDNSFYLKNDFYGEKNRHGSIFMDEECSVGDEVLLLHGHHMKDGTMFGDLKKYKDSEFRKENKVITLEFEDGVKEYEIFAVAKVDLTEEESFRFEDLPKTQEEKAYYIEGLDDASFWYDEIPMDTPEDILILSTCDYGTEEERLLVAAKEMKK